MAKAASAYSVKLSKRDKQDLTTWLVNELTSAEAARAASRDELEYAYTLYEQGRTRIATNAPYADGADLTSYLGTQYVDALTARAVKTVFTEPICVVEGVGASAARAPIVEEFHQWKAESERLQIHFARAIRAALIERRAAIEVYEGSQRRKVRKTIKAKLALEPDPVTGAPAVVLDEEQHPRLQQREDGTYVEAETPEEPQAEVIVESWDYVRSGPQYRVLNHRDFLILPGHATRREDVWGYAKRIYKRVPELDEKAQAGIYDKQAVKDLGDESERDTSQRERARSQEVAPQEGPTAEKELWEVTFLRDLDDDGVEEWYLATVSTNHTQLLRLVHDDLGQQRFILLIPFGRAETELDGYSVIADKLITTIEEHTACRNMNADRSALVSNAPILRLESAKWDPRAQPFGARAVIDVARMDEIQPLQIPDLNASSIDRERACVEAAQRIIGLTDAAMGNTPQNDRTLGEVRMVAGYSEVRIEEMLMNLREPLEDLYNVRHEIWKRTLREQGERGQAAPKDIQVGLERRLSESSVSFDGRFTADLLDGEFRFKPRGSVETADVNVMRNDFVQGLNALGLVMRVNPQLQMQMATPQAASALLEQWARVFRVPDRQAFTGSAMQQMPMGQPGMMPQGAPGMPPGMAPGMAPGGAMPPQGMGGGQPMQEQQGSGFQVPRGADVAAQILQQLGGQGGG